ncbi:MAG: glyceraldehyde 3-phosphate dehydrogenase NAD-binding domain-containing protein [Atribacterota bacterium]|nr:glyceraldehyde 3-phosphate dehydrogenase NAD-binding domain-containing protein [Atribacterota bacterium]
MNLSFTKRSLGINGLGRIGKLTLWYQINENHFDGFIINVGRPVGKKLEDIAHLIATDSTYGPIERFLYGSNGKKDVKIIDKDENLLEIFGKPVKILCKARNPKDIEWKKNGVKLVVDTTGAFNDPTIPDDNPKGSIKGHLTAGAWKVINSAPFKIKDKTKEIPEDCNTLIYGINHTSFNKEKDNIISGASCTTTALAHMVKPLLERRETRNILTASLSTIHAATNSQNVLDSLPKAYESDLRKNRMVFNNIILSSTGAASTLDKVLPEVKRVGFMADSVRIPIDTVSLIILNLTFQEYLNKDGNSAIDREFLNSLYKATANGEQKNLLCFSEEQNISSDLKGKPFAVIIEGHDTHTRTGFINLNPEMLGKIGLEADHIVNIPVTHSTLFGWYDNEYGSYVNCLGKLTVYIDNNL